MSLLDAMFIASPVYFQYVNQRAAQAKKDRDSRRYGPGP